VNSYFLKQQDDIPAGMGYPFFGKAQKRFLKFLPIVMVLLEIFKDGFLISVHRFGIGYLR